jgi:hypothetical protein
VRVPADLLDVYIEQLKINKVTNFEVLPDTDEEEAA